MSILDLSLVRLNWLLHENESMEGTVVSLKMLINQLLSKGSTPAWFSIYSQGNSNLFYPRTKSLKDRGDPNYPKKTFALYAEACQEAEDIANGKF